MTKRYEHIDFKPPKSVAKEAEKGLKYRRMAGNKGGLSVEEAKAEGVGSGVQRAVNLKNRDIMSPDTVKRMKAFFDRHKKNKAINSKYKNEPWRDKGYVAHLLWGGDSGYAWAKKIVSQMEAADKKSKKAMAQRVASNSVAAKKVKKVIRKREIKESEYELCPHCSNEIHEKGVYCNEKGLFFHRACGNPIEYLEPDYTKYSEQWLTPDQLKIREQQLENKGPEGQVFYFRIRTYGGIDNKHDFGECHPKCEYLEWTPDKYGYCNLFKKSLGKCRCPHGSGALRSKECISAVEGLI